ncbi:MAG: ankyrin repeat domain-containing protein, partial [Bdellovibrionota bacterium]|nr:ankyrin repeat domain-containing protein [Bdellovibrionota bacterium]
VSPNRKKNNNKSPLALATFKENKEMIEILLNKGADVNILGCYPLISAIGRRNITIIQTILGTNKVKKKNIENAIAITKGKIGTEDIMDLLLKALEKAPL